MRTRLDRLSARRFDNTVTTAKLLNETWKSLTQSDSVRYVIGAMQPIDPAYTANTFAQGDRVKNQLEQNLTQTCDYEYQGSTTNNTHIKAASDIDLLVLLTAFYGLEPPQQPTYPYPSEEAVKDLMTLRSDGIQVLRRVFPEVKVDDTGAKSVVLTGGSLTRKVDVVPGSWYHTNDYTRTGYKTYRGVHILDAHRRIRIANTPFLHNAVIDYADGKTSGGLRKAARLMKSLKYDTEAINLSSYDIVAIAYNIPKELLTVAVGQDLMILEACLTYCRALESDANMRATIAVPDGSRKVFAEGHATLAGLQQLTKELTRLEGDVLMENQRSFRKLAEARVIY